MFCRALGASLASNGPCSPITHYHPFKPNGQFDEGPEWPLFFQISEELLLQLEILVLPESLLGVTSTRFNPSLAAKHEMILLVDCMFQLQDIPSLQAVAELVKLHPSVKRIRFVFPSRSDGADAKEVEAVEQKTRLEWAKWTEVEGIEAAKQLGVELTLENLKFAEHGVDSRVPKSLWRARE